MADAQQDRDTAPRMAAAPERAEHADRIHRVDLAEHGDHVDLTEQVDLTDLTDPVDLDEPAGQAGLWSSVRETVLVVGLPGGLVTAASPSWRAYGHVPDHLRGRRLVDLVHPDDVGLVETYLAHPRLARDEPTLSARMRCGDGSWLGAIARVQYEQGDNAMSVTFLPMDEITADTLDRERRAADQLRLIDEMKHHLLEVVSHELRTPLTVVSGFAQTLQRLDMDLDPERLHEIGASIGRQASRLEAIVTDLIDLDRGTRGQLVAEHETTELSLLVRKALDGVDLGARPLRLDLVPVTIPVDRDRVLRAVTCLLDNVRRHTPGDTAVEVEVGPDDGGAFVRVTDDGPGLTPEVREQAFSPFAQGRLRESATPGLGLGLALVRRFAELHGGRCWYEVAEGGGASFLLHLPGGEPAADPLGQVETHLRAARQREAAVARDTADGAPLPPEAHRTIDAMLRAATRELGMEVAYLSTFTATDQLVLATAGDGESFDLHPGRRIPLDDTYCVPMVRGELPNVVPDVSREPRLASLPGSGLGCYVGVPVRRPDGHVMGSLCCASSAPRQDLNDDHAAVLRTVAGLLGDELAHHLAASAGDRATAERIRQVLADPHGLAAVYQPVVELASGDVVGVEALARFPDSRLRPPDVWFADAARVGLQGPLERAALLQAMNGLRLLPDDVYLAVNLSPGAIDSQGLRPLLEGVPLERVVIEVTEHAAVEDYDRLGTLLRPLRTAGARLAIDDVGAGFSSLRHVLRMEPDIIKLDRSLVSQVAVDPAQQAVTVAFAQMAVRLGNSVVAEGIEDAATLRALVDAGVTHGQGWLFDRAGSLPLRTLRYPAVPERG